MQISKSVSLHKVVIQNKQDNTYKRLAQIRIYHDSGPVSHGRRRGEVAAQAKESIPQVAKNKGHGDLVT